MIGFSASFFRFFSPAAAAAAAAAAAPFPSPAGVPFEPDDDCCCCASSVDGASDAPESACVAPFMIVGGGCRRWGTTCQDDSRIAYRNETKKRISDDRSGWILQRYFYFLLRCVAYRLGCAFRLSARQQPRQTKNGRSGFVRCCRWFRRFARLVSLKRFG